MSQKGVVALPIAGALFLLGCLVRGGHILPSAANALAFAQWTTQPRYAAGYFILIPAACFAVLGYVALWRRLNGSLALVAMVISIVGVQYLLVLFGGALITSPALGRAFVGGDSGAVEVAVRALGGPSVAGIGAMIGMNVVGHLLFAVAIWRSRVLPRLATVPFVLGPIGLLMPFFYPIELTGGALFLLAGILLTMPQPLAVNLEAVAINK